MLKFNGEFLVEIIRDGILIETKLIKNNLTNSALNSIMSNYFDNGSPSSNLYIGLIESGDMYANGINTLDDLFIHCVENENYIGNRKLFIPTVGVNTVNNILNKAEFTSTLYSQVSGIFLTTVENKTIKTGFLFNKTFNLFEFYENDTIRVSYNLTTITI